MNHRERIREVDDEEIINEFVIMSILSYLPRWVKPTLGKLAIALLKEYRLGELAKVPVLSKSADIL